MNWNQLLLDKTLVDREVQPEIWEKNYPISPFENDYKSIISSAAFRRLQDKTQVFPLDKSDFVRTRLTHSIEVSTIAKELGIMVTNNRTDYLSDDFNDEGIKAGLPAVLACAGLLHDLGNPPFGHFGEVVIGDWFKENLAENNNSFTYKGTPIYKIIDNSNPETKQMYNDLCHFEGNAQALRILSKINNKPEGYDVNLSYAVINALIKYPCDSLEFDDDANDIKNHKLGYYLAEKEVFDKICTETGTKINGKYYRHPLAFLMEAADDIAYATSDLEDALKKGLFNVDQFIKYFKEQIKRNDFTDSNKKEKSKELIKDLEDRINGLENRTLENEITEFQKWSIFAKGWLMYVVAFSFSKNYKTIMKGKYKNDLFEDGFHSYSLKILKDAMKEFVFNSNEILKLELSANKIISSLLDDFVNAVIYWDIDDNYYKPSKTDKKLIELISDNYKEDYLNAKTEDEYYNLYLRFLMVTDFISGMTDSYAKTLYQELNGID